MPSVDTIFRLVLPTAERLLENALARGERVSVEAVARQAVRVFADAIQLEGYADEVGARLVVALQKRLTDSR